MDASGCLFLYRVTASGIRKVENRSIAKRDITGNDIIAVLLLFGNFLKTAYADIALRIELF